MDNPHDHTFYSLFIFFCDTSPVGNSWQPTLYNAVDNTDVILCLFSPDYLSSQVCVEEFNLALARHLSEV